MATKKTDSENPKDSKAPAKKTAKAKETTETKEVKASAAKAKKPASDKAKAKGPAIDRKVPLRAGTQFPTHGALSQWSLVDAANIPLGRLSSFIAKLLMGKTKAAYARHADAGDFVVVINAKDVVLTGKKWDAKTYYWHTQYPGGIKSVTAQQLRETKPERLIEYSVSGMLPKGHMGRRWMKKLKVFANADHPHTAQKPQVVKLPHLGTFGERA